MKILIVHNKGLSRSIGGEDLVYDNEVEALKEILGAKNVFQYTVFNDNINKFKLIFSIWFSFVNYNKIKKIIKLNNIEIVHIHNFFPLLTASIFKAASKSGAKVVHTLHNYRWFCISGILYCEGNGICDKCNNRKSNFYAVVNKCYRNSYLQTILVVLAFKFYYRFTKYIDKYFALTSFQKQKVIELGIPKSKVIVKSNFVIANKINIEKNQLNMRKGYLFIGNLSEPKGIIFLLENWPKHDKFYELTIIGDGRLNFFYW